MFAVLAKLLHDWNVSIPLRSWRCLYIRNQPLQRLQVLGREQHIVHFCTKSLVVMSWRFSLFMCPSLSRTCKRLNTIATRTSKTDIQAFPESFKGRCRRSATTSHSRRMAVLWVDIGRLKIKVLFASLKKTTENKDSLGYQRGVDMALKCLNYLFGLEMFAVLAKLWNVWGVSKASKCVRR